EAAADLDRILADAPAWPPPADLMARVALWHLVLARPDELDPKRGLALARRAADADAEDPLCRVALGLGLLRSDRPADAVAELSKVRGAAAGRYDGLVHPALALAYLALGDRPRAAEAIRRGAEAADRLPTGRAVEYMRVARDRLR